MPQAPENLLFVLPKIEKCNHDNPRRMRFVEDPARRIFDYLPANPFEINRRDFRKDCDAREVSVNNLQNLGS